MNGVDWFLNERGMSYRRSRNIKVGTFFVNLFMNKDHRQLDVFYALTLISLLVRAVQFISLATIQAVVATGSYSCTYRKT